MLKYKNIRTIHNGFNSKILLLEKESSLYIGKILLNNDDLELKNCEIINNFNDNKLLKFIEKENNIIIYEYVDGDTLEFMLYFIDKKKFILIMKDLIKLLLKLENDNHYHYDIKFDNIMITKNNQLKLIDYTYLSNKSKLPKNPGTYYFSPPEYILENIIIPEKFDVFSIGVMIFYYFIKVYPFKRNSDYFKKCWWWCDNENCNRKICLKKFLENKKIDNKYINIIINTIEFNYKERWDLKTLNINIFK